MNTWRNQPDISDAGRRVYVIDDNGKQIDGVLRCEDFFFTGEDEIPVFCVDADNGNRVTFADKDYWGFLDEKGRTD